MALLGNEPWAIHFEILWHEYSLKYLSGHVAKAQGKDLLLLLLSGQSTREIPFTRFLVNGCLLLSSHLQACLISLIS